MEAKWNNMEQKAKIIVFTSVFDDFGSGLGWQGLHKESPKSHASPEESFRNRHRSMLRSKRNVQCSATQTALVSSNFVALALNRNRKQHWYLPIWLRDKSKNTLRNLSSNSTENRRFSGPKIEQIFRHRFAQTALVSIDFAAQNHAPNTCFYIFKKHQNP